MEEGRQRNPMGSIVDSESSVGSFSFSMPDRGLQDPNSPFEFGLTVPIPHTIEPHKDSPADILFANGRIQPHAYLFPQVKDTGSVTIRTSSTSSKDSGSSSSRSNSGSSRSSGSSTNTRRTRSVHIESTPTNTTSPNGMTRRGGSLGAEPEKILPYVSTSSRISASSRKPGALTSSAEFYRQTKRESIIRRQESSMNKQVDEPRSKGSWYGFFKACRECHSLEPSSAIRQDATRVKA